MLARLISASFLKSLPYSKLKISFGLSRALKPATLFSSKGPHSQTPGNRATVDSAFKEQSKEFYENQVENIIELKKSIDLEKILASTKDYIVLDLYADWCEPCKLLTPRLEQRVKSLPNTRLIKVNVDKCPEVSHSLAIKAVPSVFLVSMGQMVDKF
jgi:thioredoxin 1